MAIANALQLQAARRRAVPIRFNFIARAKFELAQHIRCCLSALRYAVILNFDPVTLTFELWPWTFVVCRLYRGETLYEIWAQSGNPRWSYCSLNFDHMTLNMYHMLRYALRYFAQSLNSVKLYPFMKCNDFSMLMPHVTLWPSKFVVDLLWRGQ